MLTIPNLAQENEFMRSSALSEEGFSVYYGIPLITKGEVRGVLEVFDSSTLDPAPDWLEFFEGLSKQAAFATADAEFFGNLHRSTIVLTRVFHAPIRE